MALTRGIRCAPLRPLHARLCAMMLALFSWAPDKALATNGYGAEATCTSPSPGAAACVFPAIPARRVLLLKKLTFQCACPTCTTMIGGTTATLTFAPEEGSAALEIPLAASFAQGQSTPYPIVGTATDADGVSVKGGSALSLSVAALNGSSVTFSSCRAWVTGTLHP